MRVHEWAEQHGLESKDVVAAIKELGCATTAHYNGTVEEADIPVLETHFGVKGGEPKPPVEEPPVDAEPAPPVEPSEKVAPEPKPEVPTESTTLDITLREPFTLGGIDYARGDKIGEITLAPGVDFYFFRDSLKFDKAGPPVE